MKTAQEILSELSMEEIDTIIKALHVLKPHAKDNEAHEILTSKMCAVWAVAERDGIPSSPR